MFDESRIRTRVLILSDTHSALPDLTKQPNLSYSHPFPPADVAIHAGDLTSTGKLVEHERALTLLRSLPAPLKIVIPGNHDLTLDTEYCSTHPFLYGWRHPHTKADLISARDLYTDEEANKAGIFYVVEGIHRFALPNGAKLTVYASGYTPEFCDWGFSYPRHVDRYNATETNLPKHPVPNYNPDDLDKVGNGNGITIMVTHGPPKGILDLTTRGENVGCDHLLRAVHQCKPILHCFGHIHEGWGLERRLWSQGHKSDERLESLEETIYSVNEIQEVSRETGIQVKDHNEIQERKGAVSAELDDLNQQILNHVDNQTAPETSTRTSISLTNEQLRHAGYVDATMVQQGQETLFVNASIMNVHYKPVQKPWIVDLMLPATTEKEKVDPHLSIHRSSNF